MTRTLGLGLLLTALHIGFYTPNCNRVHGVGGQSGGQQADGEAATDAVDEARRASTAPGAGAGAQ
jgi:hypothetical protein